MYVNSHGYTNDAQPQMCCKHCITLHTVRQHCLITWTFSAFNMFKLHLNENDANVSGDCLAGSGLGMNHYRITSKHSILVKALTYD